jgi:hypothetical protein
VVRFIFGFSSLLLLVACKTSQSSSVSGIVGEDERTPVTKEFYERATGILAKDKSAICTAFATNANEIWTASHCVDEQLSLFEFQTKSGDKHSVEQIVSRDDESDIIQLRVKPELKAYFRLAPAPGDGHASRVVSLDVSSMKLVESTSGSMFRYQGFWIHSYDTLPGASGSPVMNSNDEVFAIQIGQLTRSKLNVASPLPPAQFSEANLDSLGDSVIVEGCCKIKAPKIPTKIGGTLGQIGEGIKDAASGEKEMKICGYGFNVPIVSYALCQGSSSLLPANCTAAAAVTAGGSCAANFAVVATSCAVSVATVAKAGECCIQGGC